MIYCDDLGYGDLSSYGHGKIKTPELDRMAAEGQRWTNFYSPDAVCTPSRAGLLTGRFPVRYGLSSGKGVVFFPDSAGGMPPAEVTVAEALKEKGYSTALIGKWHLGHLPEFLPTRQGFDHYWGIPYSNDMDRVEKGGPTEAIRVRENIADTLSENFAAWNVPILRNTEEIERPADQRTLTKRYTEEAKRWIRERKDGPFFLYLAHSMPHVPLFPSKEFKGRSKGGIYGDVIEELDHSTGEIRRLLEDLELDGSTLVVFTSDNGPWLSYGDHGGSSGPLRAGKGTTWEGGQRVPAIFWWPGKLDPGVVDGIGCAVDILPTLVTLAGAEMPQGRKMDGIDLSPTLLEGSPSPREKMFYWRCGELTAVREGKWKAHFITQGWYGQLPPRKEHPVPILHDLENDLAEITDVSGEHPEIVGRLTRLRDEHLAEIEDAADQLGLKTAR